jgi:hypothetical protein
MPAVFEECPMVWEDLVDLDLAHHVEVAAVEVAGPQQLVVLLPVLLMMLLLLLLGNFALIEFQVMLLHY